MSNIVKLHEDSEPRYGALYDAMYATMMERGYGLPVAGILGVLEMLKDKVLRGDK